MKNKTIKGKDFPPKHLYRYYGNPEYIIDVIVNKRVYFSHPKDFNDPFDCKPYIWIKKGSGISKTTWYEAFYYLNKMKHPLDKAI